MELLHAVSDMMLWYMEPHDHLVVYWLTAQRKTVLIVYFKPLHCHSMLVHLENKVLYIGWKWKRVKFRKYSKRKAKLWFRARTRKVSPAHITSVHFSMAAEFWDIKCSYHYSFGIPALRFERKVMHSCIIFSTSYYIIS